MWWGTGEAKPRREAGVAWMSQSRPLGRVWAPKSACAFEIPSSPRFLVYFLHKHQKGLWSTLVGGGGSLTTTLAPPVPTPPQGARQETLPLAQGSPLKGAESSILGKLVSGPKGWDPSYGFSRGQEAGRPGNTALGPGLLSRGWFSSQSSSKSP